MGKVIKKRVIKISLAIFTGVVLIALGLLAVLVCDWGPEIAFAFLDGRALTARTETDPGGASYRETRCVYSFEADFKDVSAEADAELSTLGFKRKMWGSVADRHLREYRLGTYASNDLVKIRILDGHKLITYSTLKFLESSDPDRYTYTSMDGWVSIEITRSRFRSWPPRYLLYRLQQRLRRVAKNPAPKK